MTQKTHHKIALYIRVSTEEQAKNPEGSIRSQEQRLRQFIEFKNNEENFGEVVSVFVDKAKSGKNTKRPELQRLLRMIRRREVTMVMVTELSRLSRSIRDFSDIWEMMKEHGCAFLCLREQFDTTTAAGEMVLYTVANISQFERKQVSERVKANFLARAKRGLFNGGSVPYGLRVDPNKSGHLKIQDEEAEIVQMAFKTYLNEGRLVQAAKVLNDKGYRLSKRRQGGGDRTRLGYFTIDNLQGMLKNKAYAGLRVYKENNEEKVAKAVWPAIVDDDLFDRVQAQLAKNHKEAVKLTTTGRRYPFLLANVIKCGTCGDRLPGKSAHGNAGKIPYYEHGWAVKRQATLNKKVFACQPHRIQAKIVEPLVWDEVEKLLTQDVFAKALLEKTQDIHKSQGSVSQADGFRSKIRGVEEQLDALAEHLSKIPTGISPAPIYSQMQKMEAIKKELQNDLDKVLCSEDFVDEPVAFRDYERFLKVLGQRVRLMATPAEKAKIVKALIRQIEVFPDRVKIHYKVGENFVGLKAKDLPNNAENARQTPDARMLAGDDGEKGTKKTAPVLAEAADDFFWLGGSKRLTNGRGDWTRTSDLSPPRRTRYQAALRPDKSR